MQKFISKGCEFAYEVFGKNNNPDLPVFVWAHGWGQSHKNFLPLIASLEQRGRHIALDLPGFGQSPEPAQGWSTKEQADAIAAWMIKNKMPPVIWIGHSYGCRIATQLAAHYPQCVRAMAYIGGAGLKTPRPFHKRAYLYLRVRLFKLLRSSPAITPFREKIIKYLGSSDYKRTSGLMRKLFVRVVNEDLANQARNINCRVALIYGSEDKETPPSMGRLYAQYIKNSDFYLLEGLDHYSVLGDGRHRVIKIISDLTTTLET